MIQNKVTRRINFLYNPTIEYGTLMNILFLFFYTTLLRRRRKIQIYFLTNCKESKKKKYKNKNKQNVKMRKFLIK